MTIIEMTLSASLMILVIEILRRLTIHSLPKKTFVVLWGVVTLRLLIPYTLPFRFSFYTGVGKLYSALSGAAHNSPGGALGTGTASPAEVTQPLQGAGSSAVSDAASSSAAADPNALLSEGYIHYTTILQCIWIMGIIVVITYFFISYIKNIRKFRESLPADNHLAREWAESLHIRRAVSVRESDYIRSPLTYGILHPTILLPKGAQKILDESQMIYIITHELVHIRRLDVLWKFLLTAAVCIHWFNPLVWIMYFLANRDIELSCDETVLRILGSTSKSDYAMTLVRFAEVRDSSLAVFSSFSKNALTERITAIMKKNITTPVHFLAAGALVICLTASFATSAWLNKDALMENDVFSGRGTVSAGFTLPFTAADSAVGSAADISDRSADSQKDGFSVKQEQDPPAQRDSDSSENRRKTQNPSHQAANSGQPAGSSQNTLPASPAQGQASGGNLHTYPADSEISGPNSGANSGGSISSSPDNLQTYD